MEDQEGLESQPLLTESEEKQDSNLLIMFLNPLTLSGGLWASAMIVYRYNLPAQLLTTILNKAAIIIILSLIKKTISQ